MGGGVVSGKESAALLQPYSFFFPDNQESKARVQLVPCEHCSRSSGR